MDVETLRTFVDVVRRGSFAAVARERNVDPSSVSRAVAALEAELGLRLLHRTTRRLAPTEAGAVYFNRVEPLVDELERARLGASDTAREPRGTLRIASHVSFAQLNLVPLLPAFAARYPEINFDLVLTDASLDLVEERVDIAFRLGPPPAGLRAVPLARLDARVCASPAYLARAGWPTCPQDLARHDALLLHLVGFQDIWRFRDRRGEVTEVEMRSRLRSSNAVALKTCALGGMGVLLQARWIVGHELRTGELVDLLPDHEVSAATFEDAAVWLLYPERAYVPVKVRVFEEFVRRAFEAGPPGDRA
ncbi:LysR substrate-binding domain-containing protein [Deinococcus oregonensis]|uniref:LysR substrate-binding domain-containing protein n=1 Tax=Deinococcus oregonensis TaxID=1805970 RepID=A0ABV6AZQ2_9DEIO